jgi:hypothetical protein
VPVVHRAEHRTLWLQLQELEHELWVDRLRNPLGSGQASALLAVNCPAILLIVCAIRMNAILCNKLFMVLVMEPVCMCSVDNSMRPWRSLPPLDGVTGYLLERFLSPTFDHMCDCCTTEGVAADG